MKLKYFLSTIAFLLVLSLNSYAQSADSAKAMTIRLYCAPGLTPTNKLLYVLRGAEEEIKLTQPQLETIDPDWIQAVEVLKGEKATDKYGAAGAKGVVVITVKDRKLQQVRESLEK